MHGTFQRTTPRPSHQGYFEALTAFSDVLPRTVLAMAADCANQVVLSGTSSSSSEAVTLLRLVNEFIIILKLERAVLARLADTDPVVDRLQSARALVQRETQVALHAIEARLAETPAPRWDAAVQMFSDILLSACADYSVAGGDAKVAELKRALAQQVTA